MSWENYKGDFNSMTDEEVDTAEAEAQDRIDTETEWVEAVAAWKAAGKPRGGD